MENDDLLAAGDEFARADSLGTDEVDADAAPETFELEIDGAVHSLPAALKGAFLRQADYTRKTQELAEHRRATEADRRALDARLDAARRGDVDTVKMAVLEDELAQFEGIQWEAFAAEDPERAQEVWGVYQQMNAAREQLAYALAHRGERSRLAEAREAAARMEAVGRTLRDEIEGWSPEVAAKLVDYAQAFGVTLEELREVADPRLWKILHRAYQADQAGQRETAAQAQGVRPAVVVAGAAPAGGAVRDDLSTKEWMARRNAQLAKGR